MVKLATRIVTLVPLGHETQAALAGVRMTEFEAELHADIPCPVVFFQALQVDSADGPTVPQQGLFAPILQTQMEARRFEIGGFLVNQIFAAAVGTPVAPVEGINQLKSFEAQIDPFRGGSPVAEVRPPGVSSGDKNANAENCSHSDSSGAGRWCNRR